MKPADLLRYLSGIAVTQGRRAGEPPEVLRWQSWFVRDALAPSVETAALVVVRGNGSQYKLARIDGAALAVNGRRGQSGKAVRSRWRYTKIHKDRPGDLPAAAGRTAAALVGDYRTIVGDRAFGFHLEVPEQQDAPKKHSQRPAGYAGGHRAGRRQGERGFRNLLQARAADVDRAAEDPIEFGFVDKIPSGRSHQYAVNEWGMMALNDIN